MKIEKEIQKILIKIRTGKEVTVGDDTIIETLLTAYEKEKEKNKDLEDTLRCTQNSWYEDTKVIIDKDKLIEELKKYKK